MPVCIDKRGKLFRVVECSSKKVATRADGGPVDGGGYRSRAKARAQVQAINLRERRAEGKSAPPPPKKKRR
jgi:hypothetical protein